MFEYTYVVAWTWESLIRRIKEHARKGWRVKTLNRHGEEITVLFEREIEMNPSKRKRGN